MYRSPGNPLPIASLRIVQSLRYRLKELNFRYDTLQFAPIWRPALHFPILYIVGGGFQVCRRWRFLLYRETRRI